MDFDNTQHQLPREEEIDYAYVREMIMGDPKDHMSKDLMNIAIPESPWRTPAGLIVAGLVG